MAKLEGVKVLDMVGGQITKVEYDSAVYEKTDEEIAKYDVSSEFKVGDTVQVSVVGEPKYGWSKVKNGEIGVVKRLYDDYIKVDFPSQTSWLALPNELVRLTDEEVIFAKIGRKPGEFKKGDIARITCGKVQYVGEVEDVEGGNLGVRLYNEGVGGVMYKGCFFDEGDAAELIAPVEARVDQQ